MGKILHIIKKYWWLIFLIIIIAIVIAGQTIFRKKPEYKEYSVTRQILVDKLSVSGSLSAEKQADLKFQTGGRLAWVGVKEGDQVKKWQAIASLDKRLLQKSLQKELNDYMNERWNFQGDRETYLVTTDNLDKYSLSNAARRVLEKAQFDLNNAVLDVEIQSLTNEYAVISAPFDGLIVKLNQPNPGINTYITDVIAQIVDPLTIYFSAEVDELDISKIREGQEAEILLDAYPDQAVRGAVSSIDFSAVELSGGGTGYEVKIKLPLDNTEVKYRLGMNGKAYLTLFTKHDVLVLPVEAVYGRDDGSWVKVMSGSKVVEKRVEVGMETDELMEIISGLELGEKVVVENGKK